MQLLDCHEMPFPDSPRKYIFILLFAGASKVMLKEKKSVLSVRQKTGTTCTNSASFFYFRHFTRSIF